MLRIYGVVLEVVRGVRAGDRARSRGRIRILARQMRRAASSVALNVSEGMYSRGKNRGARYHTALGSMRETLSCIEVGVALGYVEGSMPALVGRIDHVSARSYKLSA